MLSARFLMYGSSRVEGRCLVNTKCAWPGHRPPAPSSKLITFHRLISSARLPQRADNRARVHCRHAPSAIANPRPVLPATAITFSRRSVSACFGTAMTSCGRLTVPPDSMPLRSAQFPGFRDLFDSVAPQEIQRICAAVSGGAARVRAGSDVDWDRLSEPRPDWSMLVRRARQCATFGWVPSPLRVSSKLIAGSAL